MDMVLKIRLKFNKECCAFNLSVNSIMATSFRRGHDLNSLRLILRCFHMVLNKCLVVEMRMYVLNIHRRINNICEYYYYYGCQSDFFIFYELINLSFSGGNLIMP